MKSLLLTIIFIGYTATPATIPTPPVYPQPTNITDNYTCLDICDQVCMQVNPAETKLCYKNCPCKCSTPCLNVCILNNLGPQCERMCGCSINSKNKDKADQAFFFQPTQVPLPVAPATPTTPMTNPTAPLEFDYEDFLIANHPTTKCIKTCHASCFAPTLNITSVMACLNNCSASCYSIPFAPITLQPTVSAPQQASVIPTTPAPAPATITPPAAEAPVIQQAPIEAKAPIQLVVDTASSEREFGKMKWSTFFIVFLLISGVVAAGFTGYKRMHAGKKTGKNMRMVYKNERPLIYAKLV